MTALQIRALDKLADTASFSCGQSALDGYIHGYIHRYASQAVRRSLARVFIACPQVAPQSKRKRCWPWPGWWWMRETTKPRVFISIWGSPP
jgi:hypothetical protein